MSFFVYIHTCPNNKKYVGVTKNTLEERWKNGEGYKKQKHFYAAIQKYGWENIEHESFEVESASLMLYWERLLIYHYNTINREFGYNKTSGGEQINGFCLSDDTKKKIGKGNKGKKKPPISEETRKKISEASKNTDILRRLERRYLKLVKNTDIQKKLKEKCLKLLRIENQYLRRLERRYLKLLRIENLGTRVFNALKKLKRKYLKN